MSGQTSLKEKNNMGRGLYNPVKDIFDKNNIEIKDASDIKRLPMGVKFEVVTAWMQHESLKGCGVIHTDKYYDGRFMNGKILASFENLIDRFNDWANTQERPRSTNEKSYVNANSLVFIYALIAFGERLILIYFRNIQKRAAKKDKQNARI